MTREENTFKLTQVLGRIRFLVEFVSLKLWNQRSRLAVAVSGRPSSVPRGSLWFLEVLAMQDFYHGSLFYKMNKDNFWIESASKEESNLF